MIPITTQVVGEQIGKGKNRPISQEKQMNGRNRLVGLESKHKTKKEARK